MRLEDRGKVKVFMDNRGPEIRTSLFQVYNYTTEMKARQEFKLDTEYDVNGDEKYKAITYKSLPLT